MSDVDGGNVFVYIHDIGEQLQALPQEETNSSRKIERVILDMANGDRLTNVIELYMTRGHSDAKKAFEQVVKLKAEKMGWTEVEEAEFQLREEEKLVAGLERLRMAFEGYIRYFMKRVDFVNAFGPDSPNSVIYNESLRNVGDIGIDSNIERLVRPQQALLMPLITHLRHLASQNTTLAHKKSLDVIQACITAQKQNAQDLTFDLEIRHIEFYCDLVEKVCVGKALISIPTLSPELYSTSNLRERERKLERTRALWVGIAVVSHLRRELEHHVKNDPTTAKAWRGVEFEKDT